MSIELIGILTTAIALGTVLFTAIRGVRNDLRTTEDSLRADIRVLRDDMKAGDNDLRDEIRSLRQEMLTGHDALRQEMLAGHDALRQEMLAGHDASRQEMQAGFKDFGVRLGAIGDRLSKLEGIIEGLFWSGRNQPPDKTREGVA